MVPGSWSLSGLCEALHTPSPWKVLHVTVSTAAPKAGGNCSVIDALGRVDCCPSKGVRANRLAPLSGRARAAPHPVTGVGVPLQRPSLAGEGVGKGRWWGLSGQGARPGKVGVCSSCDPSGQPGVSGLLVRPERMESGQAQRSPPLPLARWAGGHCF